MLAGRNVNDGLEHAGKKPNKEASYECDLCGEV